MWFLLRTEVVAALVMLLICGFECAPQSGGTSPCGGSSPKTSNGNCNCVPLKECCGPAPAQPNSPQTNSAGNFILAGLVDDRSCLFSLAGLVDDRFLIDVGNNKKCKDILSVCCETPCTGELPPIVTTAPYTASTNKCGIRNPNGSYVKVDGFNENQAQLGEFPWMVALLTKTDDYVGGGSLVHPRAILTAAHKVIGYNNTPEELVARIGDWDLSTTHEPIPNQNISVKKIVFHPQFNQLAHVNNVALLILESDASLSDTVRTICLPEPGQNFDGADFDGADCVVTGWGKDEFNSNGKYQKILKKLIVPAINHKDCQDMLRNNVRLPDNFPLDKTLNCAGGKGKDACTGDGGSPLVCPDPSNTGRYVQMGVVAWGIGCGQVGNPGVYGSIPATVEWIKGEIDIIDS